MKNKFCYLGIILGIVILILLFTLKVSKSIQISLTILFSVVTSVSTVNLWHNKLLKIDDEYKININDERNTQIREKSGNFVLNIYIYLISLITVIFIAYDYYIPAIFTGILVLIFPLFMIFASRYYEKKL